MIKISLADKIFVDMCRDILDNGHSSKDQEVRPKWEDGTPAHTIKKFGVVSRYDLSKEFPIITLRPTALKSSVDELLWLFQRQSNNIKDLNSKIWNYWADENGSIGRSYAYQLESRPKEEIIKITKKEKLNKPKEIKQIIFGEEKEYNKNCKYNNCGKIIESQNSGKYIILDIFADDKTNNYNKMAIVQFLDTKYIKTITYQNAIKGKVKDIYCRRIYGIGFEGDIDSINLNKQTIEKLRHVWRNMISRCYNKNNNRYSTYGAKGIFVDERWHNFSNFANDMFYIPQFFMAKQEDFVLWNLDKDYYGSNCYSKDNCVWIKNNHNIKYSLSKPFLLINEKEEKEIFLSIEDAKEKYNLKNLQSVLSKKTEQTKGFKAEYINDNFLYRYRLSINQVNDVIYQLKNNPFSRRIMTNFWNFADLPYKNLQECAYSMTFNVSGKKLNAILNQRSQDVLVANNWNVAQYAILVHMFAQVSGLEAGELVHVIADAHIYDRHIPLVEELITREQYTAPKLWINPEVKDFYKFTVDDFKLIDYKAGEQIKNIPVAI